MGANSGIGAKLRSKRKASGLTQAQVAERVGVSTALIGFWEIGRAHV